MGGSVPYCHLGYNPILWGIETTALQIEDNLSNLSNKLSLYNNIKTHLPFYNPKNLHIHFKRLVGIVCQISLDCILNILNMIWDLF